MGKPFSIFVRLTTEVPRRHERHLRNDRVALLAAHLDAHAQHNVLKSIDHIRRDPVTGKRTKTVIIITHQLSIARKADKIAMLENGVRAVESTPLNSGLIYPSVYHGVWYT